jgi:hypothetical protein
MHDTLERLLRELGEPLTPMSLKHGEEILDRLVAELRDGPGDRLAAGSPELLRAGGLRAIEADLRRYLEYEAATGPGWAPYGLELRFGFDEQDDRSLPALALGEGDDRVLVRGMIDRIDVDGRGHAIVRDYKSGASRPHFAGARWSDERRLQVALYMLVVRELTELEPVGGFYQPLRGEDLRGRGVFVKGEDVGVASVPTDAREPGELETLLADAQERATVLAAALRSGALNPCPQNCSRDGCAYPGICRSQ